MSTPAHPTRSPRRAHPGAALALGALLGLAACGGSDGEPKADPTTPAPTSSSVDTPSASATATTSPTPTTEPLSQFEDRPPVMVLRRWADAYARDINANKRKLTRADRLSSAHGEEQLIAAAHDDWGLRYPGPLPFTPVAVSVTGKKASVTVCSLGQGFAVDPKTGKPRPRQVTPARFVLVKAKGSWLLDEVTDAKADCGGVVIRKVTW